MSNNKLKPPILFTPQNLKYILNAGDAKGFSIPIYQRLYSWSRLEIEKLLNDTFNAASTGESQRDYFLGNLTLNYNQSSRNYDVIDGQQRLTTLWLIGLVLKLDFQEKSWNQFLVIKNKPTLKFVAREKDNFFLENLLHLKDGNRIEVDEKLNPRMVAAIKIIKDFLESKRDDLDTTAYSKFLLEKVRLAAIFLPQEIDLNKYFEDMNNRGLQLEPHHIIKAKLLEKVEDNLQSRYSKIWDAVSQMDQYIEYGLGGYLIDNREKIKLNHEIFFRTEPSNTEAETKNTLIFFIHKGLEKTESKRKEKSKKIRSIEISIVNFNEFFLLCLDLYKQQAKISLDFSYDDKKLIKTFSSFLEHNEFDSKEFIELLFKARICFDDYFIKSVTYDNKSQWNIQSLRKSSEGVYERSSSLEKNRSLIQLQSMLNVSTTYNKWLPQAMEYILQNKSNQSELFTKLKEIERNIYSVLPSIKELCKGTKTSRYWFFKLDYLLWEKWTNEEGSLKVQGLEHTKELIRNFQFRDNRSIEHVQPVYPNGEDWQLDGKDLKPLKDQFGNLALISIRSNSSYNNQIPELKRDDFLKRSKHWGIESLKLLDIYKYPKWDIISMKEHQRNMYSLLEEEYNK